MDSMGGSQDNNQLQDLIFVIEQVFLEIDFSEDIHNNLKLVSQVAKNLDSENLVCLADYFYAKNIPVDNRVAYFLYLLELTGDSRFGGKLNEEVSKIIKVGDFYEVFWNIARRSFVNPNFKFVSGLRDKFQGLSMEVGGYIHDRDILSGAKGKDIKRVAILSPQILGMRHSPTREAFSLACHLKKYHDCEVIIINTNGMVYHSSLNIYEPFVANCHRGLYGDQEIHIDYLEFKNEKLNIISFDPERMNVRKLVDILDVINCINVDAVISHGENLLVQDAIFGKIPSIFVTTGAAIPFARSDCYWVPGNLLSAEQERFANSYGHFDFLRESMIVTPEGMADSPRNRAEFGIAADAFIFLVVSTRMESEIETEFVKVCQEILTGNDNAVILFMGSPGFVVDTLFDDEFISTGRVVNGGFTEDLPSVCLMSEVYLNPKRQGGGTSSQTAILNSLPVVTLDYGHISAVVPNDRRWSDWGAYYDYARNLCRDRDFLESEKAKFIEHFSNNLQIESQVDKIYRKLTSVAKSKYFF